MKSKTVDAIRDLALQYENRDLQIAFELMKLAHEERPHSPFIKRKYLQYQNDLEFLSEYQLRMIELIGSGNIAIIPIGFRCFTTKLILENFGLKKQISLPFDAGFFSPYAVASVMQSPKISLELDDQGETHSVCIKNEYNNDENYGVGIKFTSSTYEYINSIVTKKDIPNINKYLDNTFGYYTLDKKHKFVLAHYNWHRFADLSKSKGITNPKENLSAINTILNRRIERMMEMCDKAKHVFLFFGENQNYKYIQIDEEYFKLDDFDMLNQVCKEIFGSKFSIINMHNSSCASNLLKEIHNKTFQRTLASSCR